MSYSRQMPNGRPKMMLVMLFESLSTRPTSLLHPPLFSFHLSLNFRVVQDPRLLSIIWFWLRSLSPLLTPFLPTFRVVWDPCLLSTIWHQLHFILCTPSYLLFFFALFLCTHSTCQLTRSWTQWAIIFSFTTIRVHEVVWHQAFSALRCMTSGSENLSAN